MQNHLRGDHGKCLKVFFNVFVSVTPSQVCSGWSILCGETIHNFADTATHLPLVALQFWSGVTFLWQPGYKKSKDQLGPCVAPRNVRFHSKVYRAASNIWVVMAAMFIPWDPLRVPVAGCFPGGHPRFFLVGNLSSSGCRCFQLTDLMANRSYRLQIFAWNAVGRQGSWPWNCWHSYQSRKNEEPRIKCKVQTADAWSPYTLYIYVDIYIYLSLSLHIILIT